MIDRACEDTLLLRVENENSVSFPTQNYLQAHGGSAFGRLKVAGSTAARVRGTTLDRLGSAVA
jgi:hypothetical protein